jgi:hypothetical protein
VISGSYLVAVHGAKWAGRFPYQELIISVKKNPHGPNRVTFSEARTWPIVLGEWSSVISLIVLVLLLVALVIRRVPALRGRTTVHEPSAER